MVKKALSPENVARAARVSETSDEEMLAAIQYSLALVDDHGKGNVAAAHVMYYLHAGRVNEAANLLQEYLGKYEAADDLLYVKELVYH